jgi:hypothetical protein
MRTQRAAACCAIGALSGFSALAYGQAEPVNCETAKFTEDVLERFPRIHDACHDIIQKPDGPYAIIKADITRVRKDGMDVRFVLRDGEKSEVRQLDTQPDFRVQVQGQPYEVKDLAVGQHLTAYVKVSAPVVALEQPPNERSAPPMPLQGNAPPPPAPTHVASAMPKTASPIPTFTLIGIALICVAGGLRRIRRRA